MKSLDSLLSGLENQWRALSREVTRLHLVPPVICLLGQMDLSLCIFHGIHEDSVLKLCVLLAGCPSQQGLKVLFWGHLADSVGATLDLRVGHPHVGCGD